MLIQFLLFSSLRIFGHQIDEKNPAEIGEIEGEENDAVKMREVNICVLKTCANNMVNCIWINFMQCDLLLAMKE